jgi:hypothetical protein
MQQSQLKQERVSVREIVKDFREGRLLVPEFQREYVWRKGKAPKLIESLYRAYPISLLLVWESQDRVEVRRQEPHRALMSTLGWLVDGQQRVTTLVRTMSGDEGIDVVFNVEKEEFASANAATRRDYRWVRVSEVWDDDWYRPYRKNLPEDSKGKRTEARLEQLRKVLDYEVPVIRMVGYSFQDAVESFKRINYYGVRLQTEDLRSAEVAARHGGFIRKRVAPFLNRLQERGFDRVSATHLFRACAFVAQPDGRRKTPLHELDTHEIEQAWRRTTDAVEAALGLIAGELGVADMGILWSGSLLVPVIALCATVPPKDRDDREIAGWVALAALHHRYSRSAETALEQDLRACRNQDPIRALLENLKQGRKYLGATDADFDGLIADKSGLLATYIACKQLGAKDLFTGRTIQARCRTDRHHILPRALFQQGFKRQRADVLANIAFVISDTNKSINDANPAAYLSAISTRILKSQAIPLHKPYWDVSKAESFWDARKKLLEEAFNAFLKSAFSTRRLFI